MKKVFLFISGTIFCSVLFAQAPQGISHQAVIRNSLNEVVTNTTVGIRVSILQGSPTGTVVYKETQAPVSNANGLITYIIGQGVVETGVFDTIDWSNGPYFLKTEADPDGGTNYTITGTTQLLSVPFALHAKTAENLTNTEMIPSGAIIMWSGNPASIPAGWQLCDGTNGTPDLRDRFVVGAGSSYSVGNSGGASTVTLSVSEMPSHNHGDTGNTNDGHTHSGWTDMSYQSHNHQMSVEGPGWAYFGGGFGTNGVVNRGGWTDGANTNHQHSFQTGSPSTGHAHSIPSQGGGLAHENRPPYFALCFIMKN
jgi:microcystin-dependent protein